MMMMKTGILGVAVAAGFLALGSTPASAQVALASATAGTRQVRVINDYHLPVRVYVQDAQNRLHPLGRVLPSTAAGLELDTTIAADGSFRLKVVPEAPAWARLGENLGIRSREITLAKGEVVSFWVEADLMTSRISKKMG